MHLFFVDESAALKQATQLLTVGGGDLQHMHDRSPAFNPGRPPRVHSS